jgi:hypothetical protein
MNDYCFSQDLGKLADYHAYVLTETRTKVRNRTEGVRPYENDSETDVIYPEILVRWVERKQVPYDIVIDDAEERLSDLRLIDNSTHLIDITGVGQAVWDMMLRRGLNPIGISITGGLQSYPAPYGYTVPKADLITTLQLALRQRCIKFAKGLDEGIVEQIKHEFSTFKEKPKLNGGTTFEAWREKDHDDIILALAINVWWIFKTRGIQIVHKRRFSTADDYDPLHFGM